MSDFQTLESKHEPNPDIIVGGVGYWHNNTVAKTLNQSPRTNDRWYELRIGPPRDAKEKPRGRRG